MNLFHYIHHSSEIHKMDSRSKLFCMIAFGITTILMKDIVRNKVEFIMLFTLIAFLYSAAKLPVKILFKEMKYFYFVIPFIIFTSAFEFKANNILLLKHFSLSGLAFSVTFCTKLVLFSLMSIIFIATTTIRQITFAIEYLLRPLPFISSVNVATMISLTIIQVPVIFDTVAEISAAQKSRCSERIENPIKKLQTLIMPALIKVFRNADNLTYAYESRCYNTAKTSYRFNSNIKDWTYLTAFCLYCIGIFIINLFLSSLRAF